MSSAAPLIPAACAAVPLALLLPAPFGDLPDLLLWTVAAGVPLAVATLLAFRRGRRAESRATAGAIEALAQAGRGREAARAGCDPQGSAVRALWCASADFLESGWGRHDLERLRFLALNVPTDLPLSPRLADHLAGVFQRVRAGTLDRLRDVVATAREIELPGATIDRLEASVHVLTYELAGAAPAAGLPPGFAPLVVVRAAGEAIGACLDLRAALSASVSVDAARLAARIARQRFSSWTATGQLELALASSGRAAAVRAEDLGHALEDALGAALACPERTRPLRLSSDHDGLRLALSLTLGVPRAGGTWRPLASPRALRWLQAPFAPLSAYGVRTELESVLPCGTVTLTIQLPPRAGSALHAAMDGTRGAGQDEDHEDAV